MYVESEENVQSALEVLGSFRRYIIIQQFISHDMLTAASAVYIWKNNDYDYISSLMIDGPNMCVWLHSLNQSY